MDSTEVAKIWDTEIARCRRTLDTQCPCRCGWKCLEAWTVRVVEDLDPDTIAVTVFDTKSVLFNDNYLGDTHIETVYTARHELAHVVDYILSGASQKKAPRDHHSQEWCTVCSILGAPPETSRAIPAVITPAGRRRTVDY